jgi:hypothetical protein
MLVIAFIGAFGGAFAIRIAAGALIGVAGAA